MTEVDYTVPLAISSIILAIFAIGFTYFLSRKTTKQLEESHEVLYETKKSLFDQKVNRISRQLNTLQIFEIYLKLYIEDEIQDLFSVSLDMWKNRSPEYNNYFDRQRNWLMRFNSIIHPNYDALPNKFIIEYEAFILSFQTALFDRLPTKKEYVIYRQLILQVNEGAIIILKFVMDEIEQIQTTEIEHLKEESSEHYDFAKT